jgi:hypothetical protein
MRFLAIFSAAALVPGGDLPVDALKSGGVSATAPTDLFGASGNELRADGLRSY